MKRADILKKAGYNSLMLAALCGDMVAVRALMEAGADVEEVGDEHGNTPVLCAAQTGQLAILVYLVEECGASLRHVVNGGITVMHGAAQAGHRDCPPDYYSAGTYNTGVHRPKKMNLGSGTGTHLDTPR